MKKNKVQVIFSNDRNMSNTVLSKLVQEGSGIQRYTGDGAGYIVLGVSETTLLIENTLVYQGESFSRESIVKRSRDKSTDYEYFTAEEFLKDPTIIIGWKGPEVLENEIVKGMGEFMPLLQKLKGMIPEISDSLDKSKREIDVDIMRNRNNVNTLKGQYCIYARALLWKVLDINIQSITETGEAVEEQRRLSENKE